MLDGLERLGIREEAEQIGYTKDDYLWFVKKTGERLPYDLKVLSRITRFNYNIQLGQDRLAEICQRRLEAMPNAAIHWRTAFTGLSQDDEGVTVRADSPDGPVELRARYVVGADGAGSAVRKALGLAFDGMTWPERFVATNLHHDFESGGYWQSTMVVDDRMGRGDRQDHPRGPVALHLHGRRRAARGKLRSSASPRPTGTCCRARAATSWSSRRPTRCTSAAPSASARAACVLAGDAAHVTNPTGGFGLTTGLFDAYALWPTLAAMVLEGADPALLDIWADERRQVFLEKTSPQACAYKDFVFHACGGGEKLEAALDGHAPDGARSRLPARAADVHQGAGDDQPGRTLTLFSSLRAGAQRSRGGAALTALVPAFGPAR